MQSTLNPDDIVQALQSVLNDAKFCVAPKMSAFLEYVVMQTLDGNADRIKAYAIAIDALNKPHNFDPQQDPSVRVMALRLRNALNDYYQRTTDHHVIFQMHAGSYVPTFKVNDQRNVSLHVLDKIDH